MVLQEGSTNMYKIDSVTLKELEVLIDTEKDPKIRSKLLVVWHAKKGKTERDIAEMLKTPKSTVDFWIQRFRENGVEGLHRKQGSGGYNRKLVKRQEESLRKRLESHPMTTKEVLVYIKGKYGETYHPNSVPRLLRRLGQSLITARPRHEDADPVEEVKFRRHIKKDS